jgi:hypothetical protein
MSRSKSDTTDQRSVSLDREALENPFRFFRSFMRDLVLPVLAIIVAVLAFLWWPDLVKEAVRLKKRRHQLQSREIKVVT